MLRSALFVAALVGFLALALRVSLKMGVFRHFHKHHPGTCKRLNAKQFGFEDFQVTNDGKAFSSAGFHMTQLGPAVLEYYDKYNVKGGIVFFDFLKPDDGIKDLKIKESDTFKLETFRPHGLSLLEDKSKGEHLLYVVNHPMDQPDRIEKFRYRPQTKDLVHLKSFLSEKLYSTNDVAVVNEDVFYVTNYLYTTTRKGAILEFALNLAWGNVVFYNGKEFSTVVPNLRGPNGILLSPDGKFLYLNAPHDQILEVYARDSSTHELTLKQSVELHTSADNLHLSQSGDALWTGCHPIGYRHLKQTDSPESENAPSQVLRIPLEKGLVVEKDITELFYDHGDLIGGSSIATVYNNLLLIGSVIDNLVLCDTKGPLGKA